MAGCADARVERSACARPDLRQLAVRAAGAPAHSIHDSQLPPVLVVSTTVDPATPHVWGISVAQRLESGVLVTHHGEGHTAYQAEGTASACIRDIVDDYFIEGVVPVVDRALRTRA